MGLLQLTFCVSEHAGGCVEHLPICCREEIFEAGSQALQAAVKSHQLVRIHHGHSMRTLHPQVLPEGTACLKLTPTHAYV